MSLTSNKRAYKVTSLLIKTAILICSSLYIFYKFNSGTGATGFIEIFQQANKKFLLLTFFLMFLNWGLEAFKWKFLISPLEDISFSRALKSIFAGVTVSIFMPNRVGEFAGRIFFLEKADKIEATLKNFVGSAMQLLITIIIGIVAMFCKVEYAGNYFEIYADEHFKITMIVQLISILIVVFLILFFFLNRIRNRFSPKIQSYIKTLSAVRKSSLVIVFLLSLLRYSVFLFQYYLVLLACGVKVDLYTASVLIAITFLITSVVPGFALTEVLTRGAVAASLFMYVTPLSTPVIAASLIVWVINLAVPAVIGSAFIWKLKFFRS